MSDSTAAPAVPGRRFPPWPVATVYLGSMLLLWLGLRRAAHPYADPHFVLDYLGTELQVAALLAVCTALWFRPAQSGFRRPPACAPGLLLPLALALALNAVAWGVARWQSLPLPATQDISMAGILRTTLLVGLTEEWTYRGVLLAALCAWWGPRRGALAALLAFGLLHLLNVAGGQSLWAGLVQVVLAALTGATLLLAALATRSLWWPVLAHGLFDFFVMDRARMQPTDLSSALTLVVLLMGPLLGLYSLWRILRLPPAQPYGDGP
jgi:membrane protease YdiL (CAAX protease family)